MTDHTDDGPHVGLDAELEATDELFGSMFAQLSPPPADLEERMSAIASAALMDRSVLGTVTDVMSVGIDTLRFLFQPDRNNP